MPTANANRPKVVIVGGGLAGAASAFHLAQGGLVEVQLLEKEPLFGTHASGRNAAMVRRAVRSPAIARLARDGADDIAAGAAAGAFAFVRSGSVLLGRQQDLDGILAATPASPAIATRAGLALPPWLGEEPAFGLVSGSDGVVDVAGLLEFYLGGARRAGAILRPGVEVLAIRSRDGTVTGVVTDQGDAPADAVVNAAGPWAGVLARAAGATRIPMRPLRRHLFYTGPLPGIGAADPFVWDVEHEWYARPESGGLLLCAGDETELPPGEPGVDPGVVDLLREKLERHAPRLADVPIARVWCGLRTFAPDREFILGPDPTLTGFVWAAGLGGHGVTCSSAVGRTVARSILERTAPPDATAPMRFTR